MGDVKMIVAIGKEGEIGRDGNLIWRIPSDLKRFKSLTMGHPVVMGRKTWESLPKKPLPGRRNIVMTRTEGYEAEGAETVNSIEATLEKVGGEDIYIIGGAEIYKAFLPLATELVLTEVEEECEEADAFLHLDLKDGWQITEEMPKEKNDEGIVYRYRNYRRVRKTEG